MCPPQETLYKNYFVSSILTAASPSFSFNFNLPFDPKYVDITHINYVILNSGNADPTSIFIVKSEMLDGPIFEGIFQPGAFSSNLHNKFNIKGPLNNSYSFNISTTGAWVGNEILISIHFLFSR